MIQAAATHHWYAVGWVDWVTVIGLLLTVLGLIVTWFQAKAAKTAAEAARSAIYQTEKQIQASQLLVLIPQLRWIVTELETAIENNEHRMARRQLDSWRWQAGNIRGILASSNTAEKKLLQVLIQSTALAVTAGQVLLESDQPVSAGCMKARKAMASTCDELASWVGKHATQAVEDGGAA